MNLRHKHLAHSLTQTWRERELGRPLPPMKFGDERELLEASIDITEKLYCWAHGTGFSFDDSRCIHRENALELWENCKFEIPSYGDGEG
jgi:hypothetical protein